jgi:exopolysaccharide production protein ExoQ
VIWSASPFSSIKASVRIIGSTIVALAFFVHARSADEALKYLKAVLAIYIPVTFLAIATVPGATQWEWPAWRGLTVHKNTLGEIALLSSLVWVSAVWRPTARGRRWAWLFLAASLVLVVGSKSTTALITLLFMASIALCFLVAKWVGPAITTSAAGCCCMLGLLILVNVASPAEILGGFGKDTTFTGRSDLWQEVITEAKRSPVAGVGFGGFWTADSDVRVPTDDGYTWRATSGHQGYLDLWNETGFVGLFLLALMVVFYVRNAARLKDGAGLWKGVFLAVLIINTMESTFFRTGSFTGWLFVLSYLAVYASLPAREIYRSKAPMSGALPR